MDKVDCKALPKKEYSAEYSKRDVAAACLTFK